MKLIVFEQQPNLKKIKLRDYFISLNSNAIYATLHHSFSIRYQPVLFEYKDFMLVSDKEKNEYSKKNLKGNYKLYMVEVNNYLLDIPILKEYSIGTFLKKQLLETYGYINTTNKLLDYVTYILKTNKTDIYPAYDNLLVHKYKDLINDHVYDYLYNQTHLLSDLVKLCYFKMIAEVSIDGNKLQLSDNILVS